RRTQYIHFDHWRDAEDWAHDPFDPDGPDAPFGPVGLDELSGTVGLDAPSGPVGLDAPSRPAPLEESALTVALECKICFTQLADTATLPCGHMVMCSWCADQLVPYHQHDRTRPRDAVNCPICRKRIRQRFRIYR
ncbi:hypothetical protein LTR16_003072, partial [Cryomyces antarcticus]